MVYEIYDYFKTELSNDSLVLKHLKTQWNIFLIVGIINILLAVYSLTTDSVFNFKLLNFEITSNLLLVIFIIFYLILLLWINHKAKNLLRNEYNIKQDKFKWGGKEFHKFKLKKFKKEISKNYSFLFKDDEKFNLLIKLLDKDAERFSLLNNLSNLFLPGLLLSFFIPVWSAFTQGIFGAIFNQVDKIGIASLFSSAFSVFLIFVQLILVITFTLGMLKDMGKLIFDKQYQNRKEIVNLLEEIKLNANSINKTKPTKFDPL